MYLTAINVLTLQGCLAPVTVRIPEACMLNPSPEAAVVSKETVVNAVESKVLNSLNVLTQVGGNVLTSQRVTDVVLKAFQAAAASQGCMNNLTFGDEGLGVILCLLMLESFLSGKQASLLKPLQTGC
eukprot:scaffold157574_cov18-Tisochrysis_lutea.AAC.1